MLCSDVVESGSVAAGTTCPCRANCSLPRSSPARPWATQPHRVDGPAE